MRSVRPFLLAVTAVTVALGMAGCGGGDDPAPADAATSGGAGTAGSPAPEAEATTEAPAPLEVEYDAVSVGFGEPGAVTAPGTALGLGQPAWLNQTMTFGEDEVTGGVGVTVLEIRELSPALFDQFSNAEEFADFTPYAVVLQHQWTYDTPEGYSPTTVALFPIKEDGSDAEYLTSGFSFSGASNQCGLVFPDYDPETRTLVSCIVGLSADLPVTSVEYNGESYGSFFASDDNPYFAAPITWQ